MKTKTTLHTTLRAIAILLLGTCLLSSCEKHDGTACFQSKCTAELNGKTYIDQTPVANTLSPAAPAATPWFKYSEYAATFESDLSTESGGEPLYRVQIQLFTDKPEAFLHQPQTIKKIEIEYQDEQFPEWEYTLYCNKNNISYAKVNNEIIDGGTFQIISHDKERNQYKGTFALPFSEGTLKGAFEIQ